MNSSIRCQFPALLAVTFVLHAPAAAAATEKMVYYFCSRQSCADGGTPSAGLIDLAGTLYGTASSGGAYYSAGTLFALDPNTRTETVLHSFGSAGDGQYPDTDLLAVNGTLYGVTTQGGAYEFGTVYALDLATGAETVLHSFGSRGDGVYPGAGVIDVGGKLYGTAYQGGVHDLGIVFSINPNTGAEKVVYSFGSGTDGYFPDAPMLNVKGTLYGTTSQGGAHDEGTVFSLDHKTGAEKVLYSFCGQQNCADGDTPSGALIDVNGLLYGTTGGGGTDDVGTVFSLDPATGAESVLYSFQSNGTDGNLPTGLVFIKGTFYGVTRGGGVYNGGTVFAIDSGTGAESVLYPFEESGGYYPNVGLTKLGRALFGTTYLGGGHASGAVFKIRP
ncbi:MAG TPA: choice-of-anchor tandem repeat GloVer-containing protein [Rhizomicrobium sp.]